MIYNYREHHQLIYKNELEMYFEGDNDLYYYTIDSLLFTFNSHYSQDTGDRRLNIKQVIN